MENKPENLEAMLRSAPVPRPPADLKAKLLREAREWTPPARQNRGSFAAAGVLDRNGVGWRRWLFVLLPTGIAAALATVALVQQDRISDLRAEIDGLTSEPAKAEPVVETDSASPVRTSVGVPDELSEIARLREVLARLEADAATVARLEAENAQLKQAITAVRASLPPEFQALAEAGERASAIRCVNNLKQLGLAVRVWATDNDGENPPDILSMTNELVTPKVLVCPADSGRSVAETWAAYSSANFSYEFLSPGPGKHEQEPSRLLFRCPIHGHVGMCDGSVQMGIAKEHPEWLVSRNGALYLEGRPEPTGGPSVTAGPVQGGAGPTGGSMPVAVQGTAGVSVSMPDSMARRYGLLPGSPGATVNLPELTLVQDGKAITVLALPRIDTNGNVVGFVDDPGMYGIESATPPAEVEAPAEVKEEPKP